MRTLSNVFLASLATADLLLIIVCVPVKVSQLTNCLISIRNYFDSVYGFIIRNAPGLRTYYQFGQLFSFTWELGEFGCKGVHYMQNVSC